MFFLSEGQMVEYRQIGKNGRLHVAGMAPATQGLLLPNMAWGWEDPCTSMQHSQVGDPVRDRGRR
jgi:hypothetical protein